MGAINVILVEKDPDEAELLASLIRSAIACEVDVMGNIERAEDPILHGNYAAAVVNLFGNAQRTLDFLESVRARMPELAIVLVTEAPSVEQAVSAMRMGADDYLGKPFSQEEFQLAVRRALDRRKIHTSHRETEALLRLTSACQMIASTLDRRRIQSIVDGYLSRLFGVVDSAIYVGSEPTGTGVGPRWRGVQIGEAGGSPEAKVLSELLRAKHETGGWQDILDQLEPGGCLRDGEWVRFRFACGAGRDYVWVGYSPRPIDAEPENLDAGLELLRTQVELTGKNIDDYMGIQHLVFVDDATGLYNTRFLNHVLDREITTARANQGGFAVLFIDADEFKAVNDRAGHAEGTRVLNELAVLLRKQVRESDSVFRYGGDEFVAVLHQAELATARAVAERIRSRVEKTLPFTVSIGVALFPAHADSKQALIDAADRAMYRAKAEGRNRVTLDQGVARVG